MAEVKTAPAKNRKPFDDAAAFSPSHQRHFGPDAETSKVREFSELTNLREKEAMLVEKGKRIDATDANLLASDGQGRDINELKGRNKLQLEQVRKEIARLSK